VLTKSLDMLILTYHTLSEDSGFPDHIEYLLAKKYKIMDLASGLKLLREKPRKTNKVISITFDDGDNSIYRCGLPIIKKYNLPVTVFIITGLIGTDQPFWWQEVMHYSGKSGGELERLLRRIKSIPNQERLNYLESLQKRTTEPLKQRQLDIHELKELIESGISLGNHTHTHPMLDQCTDDEIRREFTDSKRFFDQHNLPGYSYLAYPNGNLLPEDKMQLVRESGISHAFLFNHQVTRKIKDPLKISRLSVGDRTPLWKFRLIISGLHSRIVRFTRMRRIFKH
jgi:peptidoglycan/xylan/chitin deacetylase (PgdA/CDA1 family)